MFDQITGGDIHQVVVLKFRAKRLGHLEVRKPLNDFAPISIVATSPRFGAT